MRGALVAKIVVVASLLSLPTVPVRASDALRYEYVVSGRAQAGDLEEFAREVAETLRDDRGWNLGGAIAFQRVPGGGDFTVWLAAEAAVPSFGAPCSRYYSCRNGRHVVINESRWRGGTPAWSSAGGTLRDYRDMVVNHEVGHWLGRGHVGCGGSGQPAPVMQQQSKSLNGCRANPWPLDWEREAVARARGLEVRPSATSRFTAVMTTPSGGYRLVHGDGSVFGFGDAPYHGSAHGLTDSAIVAGAADPASDGYWLASARGAVFGFGSAASRYHGSPLDIGEEGDIADLAPTPVGSGYWVAFRDGRIVAFGAAPNHGPGVAAGDLGVVALVPTESGDGYWVAASDGSVFGYGDAESRYLGSARDAGARSGIVAMTRTVSGEGYWMAAADGSVFGFGDADYHGSMHGRLVHPIAAIDAAPEGGYRLLGEDGAVFTFGPAAYLGSRS